MTMIVKITCILVFLASVVCARELTISNKLTIEALISVKGLLDVYIAPFQKAAFKLKENETTIVTVVNAGCDQENCTLIKTVAELTTGEDQDSYKISVVEGFNLPITISPENSEECQPSSCTSESLLIECPSNNQILDHDKVIACKNDPELFKVYCTHAQISADSNYTETCSDRKNFVIELQYQ